MSADPSRRPARTSRVALAGLTTVAMLATGVGAATGVSTAPTPGSTRSGDSLFPTAGNGGYDVLRYRVVLNYHPGPNTVRARTRILARVKHPLSSFSLDLQGLHVARVRVDGRTADFRRRGHELVVTPATALRGRFSATVVYNGKPHRHVDPDGSSEGWIRTPDGATALNEPVGAMTWFPVNNTPRDKALFLFRVSAPSHLKVVSNGVLTARHRHGDRTTWSWRQTDPMSPYLALVSVGNYDMFHSVMRSITGRRIPVWTFVETKLPSQREHRRAMPRIIRWGERHFGPYPLRSAGMVFHELSVGYALETQNRPFFPGGASTGTLVHELAHQWYGDSVTLRDWSDIWLNEGFATYATWMWEGSHGGPAPAQVFRRIYRDNGPQSELWQPQPAGFTDPADLFGSPVYTRGAMTLQALRQNVGSRTFLGILRAWARQHRHGTATTAQFIALSERLSGQDLDTLFDDWLFTPERPTGY